jgi:AraC family L-rhamnose operon regulatory protein RhaS
LVCSGETDRPTLTHSQDLRAQALYFHPSVINAAFDFCNVREHAKGSAWYDQRFLAPFILREENWAGLFSLGPGTAARISHLFARVQRELAGQRDESWPCRSRSYFLEILFLLDRLHASWAKAEEDFLSGDISSLDMGPVLLYLHSHYDKKFSLDELARIFHTNRTTLTRQFHATTGLPVMAYLGRLRINLAALMLRDTELSVSEITGRLGFTNLTHFGRAFRKQMGYSPREYRQRFCWMLQ